MNNGLLLWVDDEIELLKAHIIFLEKKGYIVETVTNGQDALDACKEKVFDLILLDENMTGLSGLETLSRIKELQPATPVVMVTKSEEENLMDQAIGSKIADYLIKPVNPTQILLSLKKNIHQKEIVNEAAQNSYQRNFTKIGIQISEARTFEDWKEVYKMLVRWELELSENASDMDEMLRTQKAEADQAFARFIKKNYLRWINNADSRPLMSPDVFKTKVFPLLDAKEKVFLIVFDNFRFDQWRTIAPFLSDSFVFEEELYCSILPTVTQYARNAIFSGLMPDKIAEMYPDLWVDEDSERGKNLNEAPLIQTQLNRFRRKNTFSYHKFNDSASADRLFSQFNQFKHYDLNIFVFNFIDMLSHARTEMKMVRELVSTEAAYRSITQSWFRHSAVYDLFKALAETDYKIIVTTDHGSIRVKNPIKVLGNKNTNTNLRYKIGKNLKYNQDEVFEIKNPRQALLPAPNLSTTYIFTSCNSFFAYPNNYNYYASYYKNTFQHGGISMEEMLIPLITMQRKKRNI